MKNILKQLSSLILPIAALILIPLAIERHWEISFDLFLIAGFLSAAGGLIVLISSIAMVIRIGKGTLAPWSPTSKLVSTGIYAYTRNPMITGVLVILLAESLIFHSIPIFLWCTAFFIINSLHFTFFEEPGLIKRFRQEYLEYKSNVPRWIPRLAPWKPARAEQRSKGRRN